MIIVHYVLTSSSIERSLLNPLGIVLEKYIAVLSSDTFQDSDTNLENKGYKILMEAPKIMGPKLSTDIEPVVVSTKSHLYIIKCVMDVIKSDDLVRLLQHEQSLTITQKFARWLLTHTPFVRSLLHTSLELINKFSPESPKASPDLLGKIIAGNVSIVCFDKSDFERAGLTFNAETLRKLESLGWNNLVICDNTKSICYLAFEQLKGRAIRIPYASLIKLSKVSQMSYAELAKLRASTAFTNIIPLNMVVEQQ